MEKIYYDTETTGLKPGRITQLAYIIEDDNFQFVRAENRFFTIPESEHESAREAAKITGLTPEKLNELSNGKEFADHINEIHSDFIGRARVAHNISFDDKFLKAEFSRNNLEIPVACTFDTMKIFKDICRLEGKFGFKNPKLAELASHYRVKTGQVMQLANKLFKCNDDSISYHDARYDTTMVYVICKLRAEEIHGKPVKDSWTDLFTDRIAI